MAKKKTFPEGTPESKLLECLISFAKGIEHFAEKRNENLAQSSKCKEKYDRYKSVILRLNPNFNEDCPTASTTDFNDPEWQLFQQLKNAEMMISHYAKEAEKEDESVKRAQLSYDRFNEALIKLVPDFKAEDYV